MIELDPKKIYEDFINNLIDRPSAINKLIILIENSNNIQVRFESVKNLAKIGENFENSGIDKENIFKLLESLTISDSSENVRNIAAKVLGEKFLEYSLNPMRWALQHEQSHLCLNTIIQTLQKIVKNLSKSNDRVSKFILIHELKQMHDRDFKINFERLIEEKEINSMSNYELSLILLNYFTITYLKKIIWRLKYTIENCKITEIDFQFKGLTKIPDVIQNLDSLRKLILRYNQIITIPEWINNLKYLGTLNLNVNSVKELPNSIGSLSHLKELLLWKNDLEKLPASLCNLKSLEVLNLRLNQLKELPFNIGYLINLRELNLHDNKIKILPNSISGLVSLEKLNLSWNLLKAIPHSISLLSKLKILDLERNELESIPETIGQLKNLEIINLSDNKLSTIPQTIGLLKNLKYLNLSRNSFESIPKSIISLPYLEEINLIDNKLKDLPRELKILEEKGLKIYL